MQPNSEAPLSPPRRPLDVEDYIDIIRRHRSWILGPAFAGLVIGVVGAFLWPDRYLSAGAIRVVPPQVPGRLVPTNVSEEVAARINAMYQGIVSRPNLTNLITSLNLYPSERRSKPIEDIIETMRKRIVMSPLAGISRVQQARQSGIAFSISFSYEDRKKAQEVTRELISKFIDESLRTRSAQSASTTEFLRDQLATAKKELDDADKKIVDFRQKNPSELTETDEELVRRITTMEATLQSLALSISRANQDKLQLESQLRILKDSAIAVAPPATPEQAVVQVKNERMAELDREIARLEGTLAVLKESYKDDYPEVQKISAFLTARRQQREQLLASADAAKDTSKPLTQPSPRPVYTDPRLAKEARDVLSKVTQLEGQIQAKDQEAEDMTRQSSEIRKRIQGYHARMEASPASRQQLLQLMRDKELAQEHYEVMAAKVQDSSLATDLENRRQGETLELLEDAFLPVEPIAPKRLPIIVGGLIAGISLGLLLAGIREVKDTSLKNLKDVRAYTKLAVLGSIPLLESDFVVRRRRRTVIVAWAAAFLIGVLLMSGSVYYYFSTRT
ncbi:MAG: hypothetical protein IT161_04680 [Bryobacterales bacterium]|nr:hypothetical protein [Bryobacterales bacterium]